MKRYQKHSITEIFGYFVKDFQFPPNVRLLSWTTYYDPHKQEVIFEFITDEKDKNE